MCSKHQMPSEQSSHKTNVSHVPWYAPCWSWSRNPARTPATSPPAHEGEKEYKYYVARKPPAVCLKITAKCALLVFVSGVAWAYLIVRTISPAIVRLVIPAALAPTTATSSDIARRGYVDTAAEYKLSFIGQDVFPQVFESWGEEGEVVVNGMDVEPLSSETLPTADLLMAVLSGDTKVGCMCASNCCVSWAVLCHRTRRFDREHTMQYELPQKILVGCGLLLGDSSNNVMVW